MLESLFAIIEVFSKAKDAKGLLTQERLELMNELMEKVGDVHIQTAIGELLETPHSTRPEKECDRAIGHLKVGAQALTKSLERRPLLKRLVRMGKSKRMVIHFKITGCYAIIAVLYRIQGNTPLAGDYARKAMETFELYAEIREHLINSWLFSRYTYDCGTDQMPKVCFNNCAELRRLMGRYNMSASMVYEGTLWELAARMVDAERRRLSGWLSVPKELP